MDTPLKYCPKCGEWKPATAEYFHQHRQIKIGFRVPCKTCRVTPKPSTRVHLTCNECGTEFSRPRSAVKGKEVFYCSRQCASKGYGKHHSGANAHQYSRVDVECAMCKAPFTRKRSRANRLRNNFCSRKCMGEWISANEADTNSPHYKSVSVPCRHCGQEIFMPPARINEEGNFCDLACYGDWLTEHNTGPNNPLWEGGVGRYYGPNWLRQRRKARQRDKNICQHCGKSRDELDRELDVHHKVPFRSFGIDRYREANRLENLISLCRRCHTLADNALRQVRKLAA